MKISVLESGSWGTALAAALARNGHEVTLHSLHTHRSGKICFLPMVSAVWKRPKRY